MDRARFKIARADGRSNTQVVIDLVHGAEPGRVYTYGELCAALNDGTEREYGIPAVRMIVLGSTHMLEKQHQRTLHNVRTVGYRLALAREHMGLAVVRQDRANKQMRKGLHLLQHVRWEEMDENSRRAHEGHLILTSMLYRNQVALEGRVRRAEQAIENLVTGRVEARQG